jgi:hypothetical protein
MFFLVDRVGAVSAASASTIQDAMREALRMDSDLYIEADPPRTLRRSELLTDLGLDRPGLFDQYASTWTPPSVDEFRELLRVAALSGSRAAALVGVSPVKIRKWAGGDGQPPYAVWRLLTIYAGLAPPETVKNPL